jgi:hypothetical protein
MRVQPAHFSDMYPKLQWPSLKMYMYFAPPPQSDPQSVDASAIPMSDLFRSEIP